MVGGRSDSPEKITGWAYYDNGNFHPVTVGIEVYDFLKRDRKETDLREK